MPRLPGPTRRALGALLLAPLLSIAVACTPAGEGAAPVGLPAADSSAAGLLVPAGPPPGGFEPPPDGDRFCGGHVSGAPRPDGTPGPHVTWDAYHSPSSPEALARHYTDVLGDGVRAGTDRCTVWRAPPDDPLKVLEVCPPAPPMPPWTTCPALPAGAASVVVISTMATAD